MKNSRSNTKYRESASRAIPEMLMNIEERCPEGGSWGVTLKMEVGVKNVQHNNFSNSTPYTFGIPHVLS